MDLEELARKERELDTLSDREHQIDEERAWEEIQDMHPSHPY